MSDPEASDKADVNSKTSGDHLSIGHEPEQHQFRDTSANETSPLGNPIEQKQHEEREDEELDLSKVIETAMNSNFTGLGELQNDSESNDKREIYGEENDNDDNNNNTDNKGNENQGADLDLDLNDAINNAFKSNMDALLQAEKGEKQHDEHADRETENQEFIGHSEGEKEKEEGGEREQQQDPELDLAAVINDAITQNLDSIKEPESPSEEERQKDETIQRDNDVEMDLQSVVMNALQETGAIKSAEQENDVTTTTNAEQTNARPEDELAHAELDLTEAIADALKSTEQALGEQPKESEETDDMPRQTATQRQHEDDVTHFDSLYNDIQHMMKDYGQNNGPTQQSQSESIADVISQIDMHEVIQKSLGDNTSFDETAELQSAIADALKDHAQQEKQKQKKQKKRLPPKRKQSTSELNNVIAEALRDTQLIDNNDNEKEFERALEAIVHDVVENNFSNEDNLQSASINKEKESTNDLSTGNDDLNWDSIMGNALQIAMKENNDLLVDSSKAKRSVKKSSKTHQLTFIQDGANRKLKSSPAIVENLKNVQSTSNDKKFSSLSSSFTGAPTLTAKSLATIDAAETINSILSPSPALVSSASKPFISNEMLTNLLSSIDLKNIKPTDILTEVSGSKIDAVKKSVSNAISGLMSTSIGIPSKPTDQMDPVERKRFENRERKKRWREFNTERNRDLDLKTRVIKRANMLFPGAEHAMLREEWINTEFDKRKQKRLFREQKRRDTLPNGNDLKNSNPVPYEHLFQDVETINKIVELYNAMGGNVSTDKIISSTTDKSVTLSSTASVLTTAYLSTRNTDFDEENIASLVSTIVNTLNTFLNNNPNLMGSASASILQYNENPNSGNDEVCPDTVSANEKEAAINELKKTMGLEDGFLNAGISNDSNKKNETIEVISQEMDIDQESNDRSYENSNQASIWKPKNGDAQAQNSTDNNGNNDHNNEGPITAENVTNSLISDSMKNLSLHENTAIPAVSQTQSKKQPQVLKMNPQMQIFKPMSVIQKKKKKKTDDEPIDIEKFMQPKPPSDAILNIGKQQQSKQSLDDEKECLAPKPGSSTIPEKRKGDPEIEKENPRKAKSPSPPSTPTQETSALVAIGSQASVLPLAAIKTENNLHQSETKTKSKVNDENSASIQAPKLPQYLKSIVKAPITSTIVKPLGQTSLRLPMLASASVTPSVSPSTTMSFEAPTLTQPSLLRKPGAFRKPAGFSKPREPRPLGLLKPFKKN